MNPTRRTVLLAAISLTIVACAGGGSEETTTTGSPATTQPAPTTTQVSGEPGATADVTIAAFAFSGPPSISLGTTVTVTNQDSIQHTWTSDDGEFNSGSLSQGDTFEFTFTEAGEYAFHCGIHPEMTGSITVES